MKIRALLLVLFCCLGAKAQLTPYDSAVARAKADLAAGRLDQALAEAAQAIALNQSRWEGYTVAAGALIKQHRCNEARDHLQKAIARAPETKKHGLTSLLSLCITQESVARPSSGDKQIRDPAEYYAYVQVVQQNDVVASINGWEAFLAQYPNSVMKENALEQLMVAYQQSSNPPKMGEAAQKLLDVNPNNLRALALLAFAKRAAKTPQDLAQAAQYGAKGLQVLPAWNQPDGMSNADYQKFKTQISVIFNGAVGMGAFQDKDYAKAGQYLRAAVEADPTDVNNIYPLAVAYLTPGPAEKLLDGVFFVARAANLIADPNGKAAVIKYGKSKYVKYHGVEDGWNELLALTVSSALPPPGFSISKHVPPTPFVLAADLVKNKQPKEMSFAEWQLVLSEGKPEDAAIVWSAIKSHALQMEGLVVKSSATKLEIAGSRDDIDQKRADIVLEMRGSIPANLLPKEGETVAFEGIPQSYSSRPFLMIMMHGALLKPK